MLIELRHLRLIGYRATLTEFVVNKRKLRLFEYSVMFELVVIFRGVAPGVAPTRRKRGPHPQLSGRWGRLPACKATPRQAFHVTVSPYTNELAT